MDAKQKRIVKVARFRILKPAGDLTRNDLAQLLRDARYRVYRLGNLALSEAYLNFHLWRTGRADEFKTAKMSELNKRLREMLAAEGTPPEQLDRFSKTGALPDSVVGALTQYKIGAVTNGNKWRDVVRGHVSLPTFRRDMAIPVRCDKPDYRRLEQADNGEVHLDLQICMRPYPRVILGTRNIGDGQTAILQRLLANTAQSLDGCRQRCFEITEDRNDDKWWLCVTYDFPALQPAPRAGVVVGVDLGVSLPLYAAINNGHARLGGRQFGALGRRIRALQDQVDARRRSIQRGGRLHVASNTARSGHGRTRKLMPTEKLMGRINKAYQTLNHQLSAAVIAFARSHGASVIQIEDLTSLKEELTGTFLGRRWRRDQLQQFLKYKAEEVGIKCETVNPKYTSRRCSKCGHIHIAFDRAYRDAHRANGKPAPFICPECGYKADPDYNAARNLATLDIARLIELQCRRQGIEY